MPTSAARGPTVRAGAVNPGPSETAPLPYALVALNPRTVSVLALESREMTATFPDRRAPQEIRFGIGDIIAITIFEAAAGGLFLPVEAGVRAGNFINLPNQPVDSKGNVSIPYAGPIQARGRTPAQVQQSIVDALKNRAIDPQAVVTLVDQRTSLISVFGEVNAPARFPASAAGEHLLDAITRAGGPKSQGFDTWVMLDRGGRRAVVPFGALVYDPSNNIFVHPNDNIYVYREPQTFVAFGASGQQGQFNFEAWRLTVAEAVAKAGGLNDTRADPRAVFLYRGETQDTARKLGIDTSLFSGPVVPVVYNVNLRDPSGYFLATRMEMRNKDVLLISNAESVETAKALQYFRQLVATINDPIMAATNALLLRSAARGTLVVVPE